MQEGQAMLPGAPKIYAAIAGVINDIGVVSKDKVNKQQGFKYRSVDDVYSVLNPALAKNKVFILPEILDETREIGTSKSGGRVTSVILKMKYTVYAEDGSHVETVLKGEAMDTGDKAINKAMAIAYKYLCFQLFCIPVEYMADPDAEIHDMDGKTTQEKNAGKGKTSAPAAKKQESAKAQPAENKEGNPEQKRGAAQESEDRKVTEVMVNTIRAEQKRTGVSDKMILDRLHSKAKSIEEMTVEEFKQAMKIFEVTKDLKREASDEHK